MQKLLFIILYIAIVIFPHHVYAAYRPKEDSRLNYRIVGFSFDGIKDGLQYTLEIAKGNHRTDDSFEANIVVSLKGNRKRLMAEVPFWGCQYTWRLVPASGSSMNADNVLHHFSTGTTLMIDTAVVRFRVIDTAIAYRDAYFFLDGNKILYNMKGDPVWYLPEIDKAKESDQASDMKLTPFGTITFLLNSKPYEINYNGDILWKAPETGAVSGDSTEHYHHEFTRLSNGHYMALSTEAIMWRQDFKKYIDPNIPPEVVSRLQKDTVRKKTNFGTLIEYDSKGNVVWCWKSSKYFMQSDIKYFRPRLGMGVFETHANAFYFDEVNKFIYVSFKNISRVLKIKYPGGEVVNAYGEQYKPEVMQSGNGLFCSQHACRRSDEGLLYLFNNNNCSGEAALPTVLMMKEPGPGNNRLEKVWEYVCTTEGIADNPMLKTISEHKKMMSEKHPDFAENEKHRERPTSGGSVTELSDHSLFVSMNNEYSKTLIVNREKKVLWSGVAERWNKGEKKWMIILQYRASIIENRNQLEQLIWQGADAVK